MVEIRLEEGGGISLLGYFYFCRCHLLKKFERWPKKKYAQIIIISTV